MLEYDLEQKREHEAKTQEDSDDLYLGEIYQKPEFQLELDPDYERNIIPYDGNGVVPDTEDEEGEVFDPMND